MELVEDGEAGEGGRDRGVFDETDVACSTAISDPFRTENVSGAKDVCGKGTGAYWGTWSPRRRCSRPRVPARRSGCRPWGSPYGRMELRGLVNRRSDGQAGLKTYRAVRSIGAGERGSPRQVQGLWKARSKGGGGGALGRWTRESRVEILAKDRWVPLCCRRLRS